MEITPFTTEHFFAAYEFNTPYQLCNSDCETMTINELLALAGTDPNALGQLSLAYTESQGDPELRQAIAQMYTQPTAADVVVLGTPVEGIYLAARSILKPTDEVIVLTPAYDALVNMFAHIVGYDRVKKWAFMPTDTGWMLDFDALEQLITPSTRLIVVNFPHNPTGFVPTPHQLEQLTQIVEAHDLWLFYDEMYHGLIHAGTPAIASAADMTPRAVVLSGLSKTYGLPGLRTGWLVIQDAALRDTLMNWKFYTSICPPAPSEFLAKVALSVREQLRQRSLDQIAHNLVLADAFFNRWDAHFDWHRPLAGSTALVKVHVPSVNALSAKLASEAGVLIQSAEMLGSDDQHMRLGLGRAGFGQALQHFEAYLQQNAVFA